MQSVSGILGCLVRISVSTSFLLTKEVPRP
nr:MAG TPA: hypothetical protein [Caudoviricetes sp.]